MVMRWRYVGFCALMFAWLIGLAAPLCLYFMPTLYVHLFVQDNCPESASLCFRWCGGQPDVESWILTATLTLASIFFPAMWHRRSLKRLQLRTIMVSDPGRPEAYRLAPEMFPQAMYPERVARAAVLRYGGRLAMALALLLLIQLIAWVEALAVGYSGLTGSGVSVPYPGGYLPLALISTFFTVLQIPTKRRVFGHLDAPLKSVDTK